jgi:anti-sigma factor RsiW
VPTDSDQQLIAAYLDGVAELSADERRRVEDMLRDDPAARADADELRGTLAALRELRPLGVEPEWSMLERRIAAAVPATVPTSWWRRLRWVAPIGALAATAATALVLFHHPAPERTLLDGGTAPIVAPAEAPAATDELWLDGHAVEIGDVDPMTLLDDDGGTLADDDLLPVQNLNWIDSLDDAAIDRAEHWLAHKPHKG